MWLVLILIVAAVVWYFLKKQRPPKPQATFTITTNHSPQQGQSEDKDAWEGAFYDVITQRSINKSVRLRYVDTHGQETERVIDIRAFEPDRPEGLVIAHCHLREATRTFRFDRMKQVIDIETGEIIPYLQLRLNDEWKASPEPVLDQLYRDHNDVLKLLLYMAKADGAVRAAELSVIANYCQEITGDARISVDLIKALLKVVDVVTITTFTRVYNKLRRERPDDAIKAAAACRAVVATQKTVHPNEQAALDVLAKPLPKRND